MVPEDIDAEYRIWKLSAKATEAEREAISQKVGIGWTVTIPWHIEYRQWTLAIASCRVRETGAYLRHEEYLEIMRERSLALGESR